MTCFVLAGAAIIFDYRVLHRGTANISAGTRPLLCLVFTRKWFVDGYNYPPHSICDIEGKKAAQVQKLQLLYPKYSSTELAEVMDKGDWDWNTALKELKARRQADKKQRASAGA